jgi:hypothetical protein
VRGKKSRKEREKEIKKCYTQRTIEWNKTGKEQGNNNKSRRK